MASPLSPEEIDRLAQRRVARKMGWYIHACVYVAVNAFLYFSAGMRGREFGWHPALGWGLGLFLHFVSVFILGQGTSVRESMVQRERDRILRDQNRQ